MNELNPNMFDHMIYWKLETFRYINVSPNPSTSPDVVNPNHT